MSEGLEGHSVQAESLQRGAIRELQGADVLMVAPNTALFAGWAVIEFGRNCKKNATIWIHHLVASREEAG